MNRAPAVPKNLLKWLQDHIAKPNGLLPDAAVMQQIDSASHRAWVSWPALRTERERVCRPSVGLLRLTPSRLHAPGPLFYPVSMAPHEFDYEITVHPDGLQIRLSRGTFAQTIPINVWTGKSGVNRRFVCECGRRQACLGIDLTVDLNHSQFKCGKCLPRENSGRIFVCYDKHFIVAAGC